MPPHRTMWPLAGFLLALLLSASARAADQAQWVTLGTAGGPNLHVQQSQIANALVVGDAVYLFDVGAGALHQMTAAKLSPKSVRVIFLSHHHFDHIGDVDPVMLARWNADAEPALKVVGPPGTVALVDGLVRAAAPLEFGSAANGGRGAKRRMADAVQATDLAPTMDRPTEVYRDANIRVSAISVSHFQAPEEAALANPPRAVAYRIEAGGRVLVFSGDTGPAGAANLTTLAKDADVLITEVIDPDAMRTSLTHQTQTPAQADRVLGNLMKNHLPPTVIGQIAAGAHVKQVVLTHYVPAFDAQPDPENFKKGIAPAYAGPVRLSHDLDRF